MDLSGFKWFDDLTLCPSRNFFQRRLSSVMVVSQHILLFNFQLAKLDFISPVRQYSEMLLPIKSSFWMINLFLFALFLFSLPHTVNGGQKCCWGCLPLFCKKKEKKDNADISQPFIEDQVQAGVASEFADAIPASPLLPSCPPKKPTDHKPISLSYNPTDEEPKSTSYYSLTFLATKGYKPCEAMLTRFASNYLELKNIFPGVDHVLYPSLQSRGSHVEEVTVRDEAGNLKNERISSLSQSVLSIHYKLQSTWLPSISRNEKIVVSIGQTKTTLPMSVVDYKPPLLWLHDKPIAPFCQQIRMPNSAKSGYTIYVAVHNFPIKLPNLVTLAPSIVCDPTLKVFEFDNWRFRILKEKEDDPEEGNVLDPSIKPSTSKPSTSKASTSQDYIIPTSRIRTVKLDTIWYHRTSKVTSDNIQGEELMLPIDNIDHFHLKMENIMASAILQNQIGRPYESNQLYMRYLSAVCHEHWIRIKVGGFGQVFSVHCNFIGKQGRIKNYALKLEKVGNALEERTFSIRQYLQDEANIMRYLAFLNYGSIVRLFQVQSYLTNTDQHGNLYLYTIMEMADGSLRDLMTCFKRRRFSWLPTDVFPTIIQQIFQGIRDLHRAGIAHRDLKPDNILFFKEEKLATVRIVITDFGLSRIVAAYGMEEKLLRNPTKNLDEAFSHRGTPGYIPPQIVHQIFSFAVDYYAFGAIILEFCFRAFNKPLQAAFHAEDSPENSWSSIISNAIGEILEGMEYTDERKRKLNTKMRSNCKNHSTLLIFKMLKLYKTLSVEEIEAKLFENENMAKNFFRKEIYQLEKGEMTETEKKDLVLSVSIFFRAKQQMFTRIFDRNVFNEVVKKIFHSQPLYDLLMECYGVSEGMEIDLEKIGNIIPRISDIAME